MKIVDANVILRYLLWDDEAQAAQARDVILSDQACAYAEVLAEVVYVLQGVYQLDRSEIDNALENLIDDIYVYDEEVLRCALRIYSVGSLDFVDCLLISRNLLQREEIFTFDKKLSRFLRNPDGMSD